MTWLFWIAALLFVLTVSVVLILDVRDRRRDAWIGGVIRAAFTEDSNVRVRPGPYDWMSRPDFNLRDDE